jgi:hypothetical protein
METHGNYVKIFSLRVELFCVFQGGDSERQEEPWQDGWAI